MIYEYLIVIEETGTGFAAYSPDVLGCIATGATREEVEREMREALEFHIEGMILEGLPIPSPHTYSKQMSIAA
jgi:predicted RNase H-like HicB family nuclease